MIWIAAASRGLEESGSIAAEGSGDTDNRALLEELFVRREYNALVRPVRASGAPIEVQFETALIQIIAVDERNQTVKTNVWLQVVRN